MVNNVRLKFLPEALPAIKVQEDDRMIGWLGRDTFVNVCMTWQKGLFGGEDGTSRIYNCVMSHNRQVCVALYLEEEYEALVLECHWKAKSNVKHTNNRHFYKGIHCGQEFWGQNGVSYHRFTNSCKSWIGPDLLKLYPTSERSCNFELKRIGEKYDKNVIVGGNKASASKSKHPMKKQRSASKIQDHLVEIMQFDEHVGQGKHEQIEISQVEHIEQEQVGVHHEHIEQVGIQQVGHIKHVQVGPHQFEHIEHDYVGIQEVGHIEQIKRVEHVKVKVKQVEIEHYELEQVHTILLSSYTEDTT